MSQNELLVNFPRLLVRHDSTLENAQKKRAVKRPARPHRSPIESRTTAGNVEAVEAPRAGPDRVSSASTQTLTLKLATLPLPQTFASTAPRSTMGAAAAGSSCPSGPGSSTPRPSAKAACGPFAAPTLVAPPAAGAAPTRYLEPARRCRTSCCSRCDPPYDSPDDSSGCRTSCCSR